MAFMYCKLFASLYQGTLRGKSHEILVFTNMLAHADADGYVDKHFRAIADEVGLTVDEVKSAVALLEAPDPESRSPEKEGRRITRITDHRAWGWQIVNYAKYREIKNDNDRRESNRIAQAKWRERHKQKKSSVSNSNQCVITDKHESAPSAQVEVDAEGDGEEEEPIVRDLLYPPPFESFWKLYPRKKAKGTAIKAFEKAVRVVTPERILVALQKAIQSPDWLKDNGQFIPYPATWLNSRGWEDEDVAPASEFLPLSEPEPLPDLLEIFNRNKAKREAEEAATSQEPEFIPQSDDGGIF